MKTYIVLLRGVNVGGRNILPMKELVDILIDNNYQNVKTYIQSGNVVLGSSTKPDSNISSIIKNKFGFKPEVIVMSESELILSIKNNPYRSKEGNKVHFFFCRNNPKVDGLKLEKLKSESEEYCIEGNVLYLYAPNGVGRSKLVANIESGLGVLVTARNLNTVNKLQSMVKNA